MLSLSVLPCNNVLLLFAGKDVAKLPGGKEAMGFGKQGPVKEGLAAQAQAHLGNVNPANPFAAIQRDAMKK